MRENREQRKTEFTPLSGEKVLGFYQPHPLAFFRSYSLGFIFLLLVIIPYLGVFFLILGLIIIVLTYFYQKAHKYWITNKRIIIVKTFLWRDVREIAYNNIVDLVVQQGIFGRIFNFGTITPITASGLGTGSRFSTDSKGGLIKSTVTVEVQTQYALYGIRRPLEAKELIAREIFKRKR
jgi:uncharacterized membrane protein YdbT with pleckstrin-like domain